jgi:dTDP-4-dehydrorhamnose 3,5-epimerase
MAPPIELKAIPGVFTVPLKIFSDTRGRFIETFRREWFPDRTWDKLQSNRSESKKNVLRGLHFHLRQADYWYLFSGKVRVALADLRTSSPAFRSVVTMDLDAQDQTGLFIPPGVAHGFLAQTDAVLTYVVDNYYDPEDEHGVIWNDPDMGIDWGISKPLLSPRDEKNPRMKDIPQAELPA